MESHRRTVTGLTIAAIALIVTGLAAIAIDTGQPPGTPFVPGTSFALVSSPTRPGTGTPASTTAGPSGSPPPSPSPSPTSSPKATPRPVGFGQVGSTIVYSFPDGTEVPMPGIPGLGTELDNDRAVYYALKTNAYGLRTGDYAGEFMPNVTTQQADSSSAQTGGVALVGPVVSKLIANRLADIATPADRWIVALPVDIRGTAKPVDVGFDAFGLHGFSDTPRVVVRFSGQLHVTEIIPANAGYHVLVEALGVTTWQVIDPTRLGLPATKLDPDHPMNELLIYGTGTPNLRADAGVDKRVPMGRTMLLASDEVSVSLVVRSSRADLGPDRILKVGDVPVFAASA